MDSEWKTLSEYVFQIFFAFKKNEKSFISSIFLGDARLCLTRLGWRKKNVFKLAISCFICKSTFLKTCSDRFFYSESISGVKNLLKPILRELFKFSWNTEKHENNYFRPEEIFSQLSHHGKTCSEFHSESLYEVENQFRWSFISRSYLRILRHAT